VLAEVAAAVRVDVAEVLVEHGVRMLMLAEAQAVVATQLALLEPTTHLVVVMAVAVAGLAHRLELVAREESLEEAAEEEQVQVIAVPHQAVTAAQGAVLRSGCGFTNEWTNTTKPSRRQWTGRPKSTFSAHHVYRN